MADVSHAELVNKMSALADSWQTYIDQQRALDSGTPDYVTLVPPGQPAPGWYPLTDPAGLVVWRTCELRKAVDASRLIFKRVQLGFTDGYTAVRTTLPITGAEDGMLIALTGNTLAANVRIILPASGTVRLGHTTSFIHEGTGNLTFEVNTDPVSLPRNAHSHNASFGQDAMTTVVNKVRSSGGTNTWGLFGDTKAV